MKIPTTSVTKWQVLLVKQANILYFFYALLLKKITPWWYLQGDAQGKIWLLRCFVLTLAGSSVRGFCLRTAQLSLSQNSHVRVNKINYIWNVMLHHQFFSPFTGRCSSNGWFSLGREVSRLSEHVRRRYKFEFILI